MLLFFLSETLKLKNIEGCLTYKQRQPMSMNLLGQFFGCSSQPCGQSTFPSHRDSIFMHTTDNMRWQWSQPTGHNETDVGLGVATVVEVPLKF